MDDFHDAAGDLHRHSRVSERLLALKRALDDTRGSAETRLARARSLLEQAVASHGIRFVARTGGLAPWQMRKVAAHVRDNLDGTLRNHELAALVGLTTCHFSRAFRASFGMPPHEYVMQQRFGLAKSLMLSTNAPLGRIALDCGLSDQAHLSRMFLKFVGESPRAWRRMRVAAGCQVRFTGVRNETTTNL